MDLWACGKFQSLLKGLLEICQLASLDFLLLFLTKVMAEFLLKFP